MCIDIPEDQLTLTSSIASINDFIHILGDDQLLECVETLLGALENREPERFRDDRQVGKQPLLVLLVIVFRLGQSNEVADRP